MTEAHEVVKDVVVNLLLVGSTWCIKHRKEIRKMANVTSILTNIFQLIPYIAAGVETVHAGESTETKTQIANQVLSIATQGALQVLGPQNGAIAQAVSNALSTGIASVQAVIQATQPTNSTTSATTTTSTATAPAATSTTATSTTATSTAPVITPSFSLLRA